MSGVETEGETYYFLEEVAQWYEVETSFLLAVYERGLLGRGRRIDERPAIAAPLVDRVAAVLRCRRFVGDDPDKILLLLGPPNEDEHEARPQP